jgi:hypothetical protein
METIDKLTLELLMNKNTYNRYIEKTDPKKHKEEQEFRTKVRKYKSRMIQMTIKYLDNPDFQINNEMNEMLLEYSKTFIKYFEMNDLEVSCFYGSDDNKHEEIMFDPNKMNNEEVNVNNKDNENIECDDLEVASVAATDGAEYLNNVPLKKSFSNSRYTMDKYVLRK